MSDDSTNSPKRGSGNSDHFFFRHTFRDFVDNSSEALPDFSGFLENIIRPRISTGILPKISLESLLRQFLEEILRGILQDFFHRLLELWKSFSEFIQDFFIAIAPRILSRISSEIFLNVRPEIIIRFFSIICQDILSRTLITISFN